MVWLLSHLDLVLFRLSNKPITLAAVLVLATTLVVVTLLGRLVRRGVVGLVQHRDPARAGIGYAAGKIVQYAVVLVGGLLAFQNFGLELSALAAFGAVIGVGLGLGLQGVMQNFVSGLILLFERHIQRGDFVVIGDTTGRVVDIAIRATTLVTRDGVAIVVPNSELTSGRIINLTQPRAAYRTCITVGVAYGSDTALVKDILLETAAAHPSVLEDTPPRVFFSDFADSALLFRLTVWIDDADREPEILSDLRFAIDAAFREASVQIPFPQRDVNLRLADAALRDAALAATGASPAQIA